MNSRLPPNQRGYMLVATLWVLTAITVGAAYFSEQVSRSRQTALQAQQSARALADLESTRAEVLFRIVTSGLSVYGLGHDSMSAVRLDNRPYRGAGRDIVRLQDHRGLANVNHPNKDLLFGLLGQFGVPVEKRDALLDGLFDYIDPDDLRRLNGAEAREYAAANLPPPRNDWLAMPHELRNILGWHNQPGWWQNGSFGDFFTTSTLLGVNLNTAPLEVLASLPGNTREIATLLVRLRGDSPFESPTQAAKLAANPQLDDENISVMPGRSIRVTQIPSKLPWMLQYGVTLTPTSTIGPWRVDYFTKRPAPTAIENENDVAPLPQRVAQPAPPSETL